MPDTIIQEIRKTRDEYARQFNHDLHQMCLDLRREQELSGATVVTFSTTTLRPDAAESDGQTDTNKAGVSPSKV
jgi:DNA-binding GntR family transcriptional regulator